MTFRDLHSTGFAFGANCDPPADLAGGFVDGAPNATRNVVTAESLFRAYHECDDVNTDREAFGTVYQYPADVYRVHVRRAGSPKGYDGPAACCRLVWDIDRKGDLDAALADARKLVTYLFDRCGSTASIDQAGDLAIGHGVHVDFHLPDQQIEVDFRVITNILGSDMMFCNPTGDDRPCFGERLAVPALESAVNSTVDHDGEHDVERVVPAIQVNDVFHLALRCWRTLREGEHLPTPCFGTNA